jgi:hypothetical protein
MEQHIKVIAIISYNDLTLKRLVKVGEVFEVSKDRAIVLCKSGCTQIYSINNI